LEWGSESPLSPVAILERGDKQRAEVVSILFAIFKQGIPFWMEILNGSQCPFTHSNGERGMANFWGAAKTLRKWTDIGTPH